MTSFLKSIKFLVAAFSVLAANAQVYQNATDTIFGENCFVQVNDQYMSNGNKNGTGSYTWPSRSDAEICYYLRVPTGYAKMTATVRTKAAAVVRLRVTDPETGNLIYDNEASTTGSGEKAIQLMTDCKFTEDKWYRFALSSPAPSAMSNIVKLEFKRESQEKIVSSKVFGAPSTHLWTTMPVDPMAPSGSSYDWAYEEVMYPSKYIRPATYVEAIATLGGYMGIQTGNIVLFSMWDDGDTEKNPYLPDYLKSTCMDSHPDIRIRRFGGEGTGVQSMFQEQSNHTWKPDTWVQFLFNARPEEIKVTVKGSQGQDSTFVRNNTITTAWYKNADDKDWTYMATLRKSGSSSLFNGWYSFLEDFAENGCDFTRAYYRKCYMRSAQSGKWYNISHFNYGHTDGTQNGRRGRSDWGHGVTDQYENAFFMEQGGFFTKDHDSLAYAGVPLDQSCVDTINIQAKIDRVTQAIQKQASVEAALKLDRTAETYDMSKWEVTGFSDQSEEGDGDNGRAAQAIDGNTATYWRNKWKNGGVLYPHWIALKAPEKVTISQIDFKLGGSYLFWPKHVVVYKSDNGEAWQVASDTLTLEKKANPSVTLAQRVSSQHFKLEFIDTYGAALNIQEIGMSTDIAEEKIMAYADELVSNAGCLDYYPIEQTSELKETYEKGTCDVDMVAKAIESLVYNGTRLRYGAVTSVASLSTLRVYQISNSAGLGKLICTPEGKLSIGQAETDNAQETYAPIVDATQMNNNWMIIRIDGYNTTYVYNPGAGKYLDLNAENLLSDKPAAMTVIFNSLNKNFALRSGSKFLVLDPTSELPVKTMTGTMGEGAYFNIFDNFYLTPTQQQVEPVLKECTDLTKFPDYVKRLGQYLDVPEGLVGSVPAGEEREHLTRLYNNGQVDISQMAELYKAVDECKRLVFDPKEYVYRLKSGVEANANAPYLTANNTPATTMATMSNTNVAQIWSFPAEGEGLRPTTQNVCLGRLPSQAQAGVTTSWNGSGNVGKYYATEYEPGKFKFSTTQQGGIAYSAANAGKSEKYDSDDAVYELEVAQTLNISMQSSGLKGVNFAFDVIIPEDLEVYVVDHIDNGTAYLLRVYDRLSAGEPAIIKGASYQSMALSIAAPTESNVAQNMLRGTYFAQNGIKGTLFTLKTSDGGVFSKAATSNVAANSVYLLFDPADAPTGKLTLNFSDEPCEVNSATISPAQTPEAIYDLQGRRVTTTKRGHMYIKNGKTIKQ